MTPTKSADGPSTPVEEDLIRSPVAVQRATGQGINVSYRMLDYWVREGVIEPEENPSGSGHQRRWTVEQVAGLRILGVLARLNVSSDIMTVVWNQISNDPSLWLGEVVILPDGRVLAGRETEGQEGGWLIRLDACWKWVNRD